MNQKILSLVINITKKYHTKDPFRISKEMNIEVFYTPLGDLYGFYKYMKKHRCIYINSDIENDELKCFVMAHELGHALLHPNENCFFLEKNSFMNISKFEKQADIFAMALLYQEYITEHTDLRSLRDRILNYNQEVVL